MRRANRLLTWAVAALCTHACRPSDPKDAFVGRWVRPGEKGVLELLPGGAVVETGERERGGIWVGAGSYQFWTDSSPGVFHYNVAKVGNEWGGLEWAGMWSFDDKREKLYLSREGQHALLTREDPPLSPAQQGLVGLWKRVGGAQIDQADMGVVFTPGGIEVVVGKHTPWDAQTPSDCVWWLCLAVGYSLPDDHTLDETELGSPSGRRRIRTFRVSGQQLTIGQEGREDLVYERVHGGLPLRDLRLDTKAWEALR